MTGEVVFLWKRFVAQLTHRTFLPIDYYVWGILRLDFVARWLLLLMVHEVAEVVMMLVLHVYPQMTRAGEYGFAFLANEALSDVVHGGGGCCFLAMHSLLMSTEMIVTGEVFRAICAVIRLQFGVHQWMSSEMIASIETIFALWAFVSFAAVDFFLRFLRRTMRSRWFRWRARSIFGFSFVFYGWRCLMMLIRIMVSHVFRHARHFAEQVWMFGLRVDDLRRNHLFGWPKCDSLLKRNCEKQQVGRLQWEKFRSKRNLLIFTFFSALPEAFSLWWWSIAGWGTEWNTFNALIHRFNRRNLKLF